MNDNPLLTAMRIETAKLEATKRRRGIVTVSVLREAFPPFLRNQCASHQFSDIAKAINAALADEPIAPHDPKSKAAGE